ncbi:Spy/CpxP family protein refolding chaperone [Neptunomonas qingdaonensis]|uniref:LTXXQ motif family protein n=1 Tax=Neptunomonas qingdaonensis TaxID=1045558 RepID=A0A1I2SQS5_9GAMM|nr:Spy/CpxP family protein refolding chaperone [Neptunomonas qingdaonensis]SFG52506.1 LTXXQ motif family protein [Neptunomonas qingdaonensis]
MRKQVLVGITVAVISAGTLVSATAFAGDCSDRDNDHYNRSEMMQDHKHGDRSDMKGQPDARGKNMPITLNDLKLSEAQQDQLKQIMRQERNNIISLNDAKQDMLEDLRDLDVQAADYDKQVEALVVMAQNQAAQQMRITTDKNRNIFEILTPEQQKQVIEQQR